MLQITLYKQISSEEIHSIPPLKILRENFPLYISSTSWLWGANFCLKLMLCHILFFSFCALFKTLSLKTVNFSIKIRRIKKRETIKYFFQWNCFCKLGSELSAFWGKKKTRIYNEWTMTLVQIFAFHVQGPKYQEITKDFNTTGSVKSAFNRVTFV